METTQYMSSGKCKLKEAVQPLGGLQSRALITPGAMKDTG